MSKLVKNCSIKILEFDQNKGTLLAKFTFYKDNEKLSFNKEISFKIKNLMCNQCYRKHSGYYEAVVQLRLDPENIKENKTQKLENLLKKLIDFINKNGDFIAKMEKEGSGYDVYTSNKMQTARFFEIRRLKPKVSFTLYGLKNGKRVYRNIYLLRI